jgi:hypothetical protein
MPFRIEAELVFPKGMDPSSYDGTGVSVHDWFDNRDAPQLDHVYSSEAEARDALEELRRRYLGPDIYDVRCRLAVVEEHA